jgi:hypothetical protein
MATNERELDHQLKQFAGSLTSSDVYQNYSASYSWISNQTAHIGLGLILTGVAIAFFPRLGQWPWLILPLVLYPFKELIDVMRTRGAPQKAFAIRKEELSLDTASDISFVTVGISAALLLPVGWWGGLLVLILAGAALGYFVPRFLPVKRAFDKSGLPYFFRLANYGAKFDEPQIEMIRKLIQDIDSGGDANTHLVLFGPGQSGKTTLAVGIGSELTARKARVRYISFGKYLDIGENSSVSPLNQPWLAEECRLLIVDDVKGTVSLSPRPEHVRCSVWVTDDKNNADQLQQTLQTQWLGNNEQIHLVDVQALAYKPVK